MAYALAKENEDFIERMVRLGRFNNQSKVVREALRRMDGTQGRQGGCRTRVSMSLFEHLS